jgi:hypothetical protein
MIFIIDNENNIYPEDLSKNFALWTILITNLIAVITPIIIFNAILIKIQIIKMIKNLFTPGREWFEIGLIMLGILLIYLIILETNRISNKIKFLYKKMNEYQERIKELEKKYEYNN